MRIQAERREGNHMWVWGEPEQRISKIPQELEETVGPSTEP